MIYLYNILHQLLLSDVYMITFDVFISVQNYFCFVFVPQLQAGCSQKYTRSITVSFGEITICVCISISLKCKLVDPYINTRENLIFGVFGNINTSENLIFGVFGNVQLFQILVINILFRGYSITAYSLDLGGLLLILDPFLRNSDFLSDFPIFRIFWL